jgi:hypothetical protein
MALLMVRSLGDLMKKFFKKIENYTISKNDLYMIIADVTIGKYSLVPEKFHCFNLSENSAEIINYNQLRFYLLGLLLKRSKWELQRLPYIDFPLHSDQHATVEQIQSVLREAFESVTLNEF